MLKEEILSKIDYIKENIKELKKVLDQFDDKQDYILNMAMERISEKIIESAININNKLLEDKGVYSKSYYDSFVKLEKLDLLDKDFLNELASTAGYRNRLAHDYMDLDHEISYKTMSKLPKLYKKYLKIILQYLEKNY